MPDPWHLEQVRRRRELDALRRWEVASALFRALAGAALIVGGLFLALDLIGMLQR